MYERNGGCFSPVAFFNLSTAVTRPQNGRNDQKNKCENPVGSYDAEDCS
jgi:hypothetical protein